MLEIGIVNSSENNNKVYYSIDKDNMFYEPLRQIFLLEGREQKSESDDQDVWMKRFSNIGEVKIVIFAGKLIGDLGRGDRDVDLLVVGNISDARLKNLVKNIEKELKINTDALNYANMSYLDFYRRLKVKDSFTEKILAEKHKIIIDTESLLSEEE